MAEEEMDLSFVTSSRMKSCLRIVPWENFTKNRDGESSPYPNVFRQQLEKKMFKLEMSQQKCTLPARQKEDLKLSLPKCLSSARKSFQSWTGAQFKDNGNFKQEKICRNQWLVVKIPKHENTFYCNYGIVLWLTEYSNLKMALKYIIWSSVLHRRMGFYFFSLRIISPNLCPVWACT